MPSIPDSCQVLRRYRASGGALYRWNIFGTRTTSKPNHLVFLLSVKITARGFTIFRTKCTLQSGSTPGPLCNVQLYPCPFTEDESRSAEWQAIAVKKGFLPKGSRYQRPEKKRGS